MLPVSMAVLGWGSLSRIPVIPAAVIMFHVSLCKNISRVEQQRQAGRETSDEKKCTFFVL
jgi:hypothetical protein